MFYKTFYNASHKNTFKSHLISRGDVQKNFLKAIKRILFDLLRSFLRQGANRRR